MIILIFLFISNLVKCEQMPFGIGESFNYNVFFSGLQAGHGELSVIKLDTVQNLPSYHVRFSTWTTGFTNKIYPINDIIDLWLDTNTLKTLRVDKNIQEGNYKKNSKSFFNHDDGLVIIDGDSISVPKGIISPYSLFYSLRNKIIPELNGTNFKIIDGKKVTELKLIIESQQNVIIPGGNFLCNKVTPVRNDKKKFKNKGELSIWFSEKMPEQIPVKIWIKLNYGSLKMELDNWVN